MIPKYKQKEKRSWQNIFFVVLLGSLVIIVVGFLAVSNFRMSRKRAVLNSRIEQLKEEIGEAEERKQQLQAQLNQVSREEYLEKEAREKLNLKKPGEEVVVVVPSGEEPQQKEEKAKQWWNPLSW